MTKVEQVARALQGTWHQGMRQRITDGYAETLARAAIEAMKGPTPGMCDMGEGFNLRCGCPNCDHAAWEKVAAGFDAMLDAALAEE